ncbi:MAG: homoserine kinase, partial [Bacilli bacterium]|nr:homoserine kinase [Bacilli bacterium]
NLVLASYKRVFEVLGDEEIKVRITEVKEDIPVSRGLGSSAACIVAGVVGANNMLGNILDINALIDIATSIEGHPDNVLPCFLGGLTSGFISGGEVYYTNYDISKDLFFTILVPNFPLETIVARNALPEKIDFKDAMDNLAKAVNLPIMIASGDFYGIKKATRGAIHEKYRYPLITGAEKILYEVTDENHVVLISGAGPSLLVISDIDDDVKISNENFKVIKVKANKKGVEIK